MAEELHDSVLPKVTSFKHDIIKEVLKMKVSNPKNKITDEAVELISEIIKCLIVETATRAAKQALSENSNTDVTLKHVEAILPQLIFDFP